VVGPFFPSRPAFPPGPFKAFPPETISGDDLPKEGMFQSPVAAIFFW
jgi:hypothetical protein